MVEAPWFIGWLLPEAARSDLLHRFPQRYPRLVADHVTLNAHASAACAPPDGTTGLVVGEADDGRGVQALVIEIGGSTTRPDGGTWHITWSLAPGRRAVESNDVIAALGWRPAPTVPIALVPERRPRR